MLKPTPLDTSNQQYAPSGNALCGCPRCGPLLARLVEQHLRHSPQSWQRKPFDKPAEPGYATPLPGVWHGFDETAP